MRRQVGLGVSLLVLLWAAAASPWPNSRVGPLAVSAAEDNPCAVPDALLEAGRLEEASREYAALEAEECATEGLASVDDARADAARQCLVGDELRTAKLADASKAAYLDALKIDRHAACAFTGLKALASPAPTPAPDPVAETSKGIATAIPTLASAITIAAGLFLVGLVLAVALRIVSALYRRFAGWRSRRVVTVVAGPAEGEKFKLRVATLSTLLRDALEEVRIYPAPPALDGSMVDPVVTIANALPNKEAGALAGAFLGVVKGGPVRRGWEVTVLTPDDGSGDEKRVLAEVRDERGNLRAVERASGEDDDAITREVAARIYQAVHARFDQHPWEAWTSPSGEGLASYEEGRRLQNDDQLADARAAFAAAALLEPNNVVVRLALARVFEDGGDWINALECMATIVGRWPTLVGPRYRFAADLSFAADWVPALRTLDHPKQAAFFARLQTVLGAHPSGTTDADLILYGLAQAQGQYGKALDALGLMPGPEFRARLRFRPARYVGRTRAIISSARAVAELQAVLRQNPNDADGAKRVERGLPGNGTLNRTFGSWQAHYNRACFYSRGSGAVPAWRRKAVVELRRSLALVDQSHARQLARWISTDPDLRPIKDEPRFISLLAFLRPPEPPPEAPAAESPPSGEESAAGPEYPG